MSVSGQSSENNIKILFLGSQITVGGAQRVLLDQATWFHMHDYEVNAAFLYDRDGLSSQWQANHSFPIINLDSWHPTAGIGNIRKLISGVYKLYSLLHREQYDIIETFAHHANILAMPVAWITGTPVRLASHHGWGEGLPPLLKRLHTLVINSKITDALVVVSRNSGIHAEKIEGIEPKKIIVIPNGIDFSQINSVEQGNPSYLNKELRILPGSPIILCVGRLAIPKGHKYLLEAIPMVLAKFPEAVFILAGDGPLRPELEQTITGLGIEHAVRLIGTRSDIPALLGLADIFALPSLSEGMPISMLEAMGAGLPVVVTQVGGIGEVIEDGENGLIVSPAESDALGEAILCLLSNPDIRRKLGLSAKSLVEQEYNMENMGNRYKDLFHNLLEANA